MGSGAFVYSLLIASEACTWGSPLKRRSELNDVPNASFFVLRDCLPRSNIQ